MAGRTHSANKHSCKHPVWCNAYGSSWQILPRPWTSEHLEQGGTSVTPELRAADWERAFLVWTHGAGSTMLIISPETEAHWTQMGAQFVSEHPNPILTTPVRRSQNMNVNQSSTCAAAHPWIWQTCSGNTWRITAFVLEMSRRLFLPLFPKLHCVTTTLLYALLVKTLTRVYRRTCRFHANVRLFM